MRATVTALIIGIAAFVATDYLRAAAPAQQGGARAAGRSINDQFAGTWKLISQETRDAKGQVVPPAANAGTEGRIGFIVYDPAGYMGVVIQQGGRQKFASNQPTPPEARAAMGSYTSYWGSFAVNEAESVVTHQTWGALNTGMSGTDQRRHYAFSGNRLTLQPPAGANGNQASLTWERVPDLPSLTPTHRRLIGFWKEISYERRDAKGELITSNPGQTGFIVYTASGNMMVHMMQPYRRRNEGAQSTAEETMANFRSYISYFGTYTIHDPEKYVVHHLMGMTNPGSVGADFQRFFEISGRRLILRPPTPANGGKDVITWERLGPDPKL